MLIPPELREQVERRVASGDYPDAATCLQAIWSGMAPAERAGGYDPAVEAAILESLDSGPAVPFTRRDAEAMAERIRRRVLQRTRRAPRRKSA